MSTQKCPDFHDGCSQGYTGLTADHIVAFCRNAEYVACPAHRYAPSPDLLFSGKFHAMVSQGFTTGKIPKRDIISERDPMRLIQMASDSVFVSEKPTCELVTSSNRDERGVPTWGNAYEDAPVTEPLKDEPRRCNSFIVEERVVMTFPKP